MFGDLRHIIKGLRDLQFTTLDILDSEINSIVLKKSFFKKGKLIPSVKDYKEGIEIKFALYDFEGEVYCFVSLNASIKSGIRGIFINISGDNL